MVLSEMIYKLRTKAGLSQEKLAELCGVSRQAVQKWETGNALPELNNLVTIAKRFNVSLDNLVFDPSSRIQDSLAYEISLKPQYSTMHVWEVYSRQLEVEYSQCYTEGKDIEQYKQLFDAVIALPVSEHKEKLADVLFNIQHSLPTRVGYEYNEPNNYDEIRTLCEGCEVTAYDKKTIADKIKGAWVGRICGCLLGKPVEGIGLSDLTAFLKDTGNYPMTRYIHRSDFTKEVDEKYSYPRRDGFYPDSIVSAPVDDDTNYTVLAQVLIEKYGRDFTPYDVSRVWLDFQPKNAYCTAERVAFRNFIDGYVPPYSAQYKNPYREWIGAQIRADYFGYINPGNPEKAAEMAYRDACISHVKNGIYGEMWVAGMIAQSAVENNITKIIKAGLRCIPQTSRLYKNVVAVIDAYEKGVSEKEIIADIHSRWDEKSGDWCHTISNAEIVTAALLWGKGDYGKSICMAVQACFDTDCNGATVGSILGMRGGTKTISAVWKDAIRNKLQTSIFGVGEVNVDDVVATTVSHLEK